MKIVIDTYGSSVKLSQEAVSLLLSRGSEYIMEFDYYDYYDYFIDGEQFDQEFIDDTLKREGMLKKGDKIFCSNYSIHDKRRYDPLLIQVIEELGNKCSPNDEEDSEEEKNRIKIVDIPDDVEWYIESYEWGEHVAEKHRTWDGSKNDGK
jgi:hypothetical protein